MQREPDKLRSVYWLLTQVQDCENWKNLSKDLSKLLCFWVVSTGCAHPFPKGIKSMVQSVEGMGSELRAAVWCPSLLCETCAKWGRCRNLSVLASPATLDIESWNPNKEDINQRMPKWLFPFWWRLVSWTGFCLLLSPICFLPLCTSVSRRKTFPSSKGNTLPGIFICSALNNHYTLYSWGCNLCNSQYLLGLWRLCLPGEDKGESFSSSEARRSKLLSRVLLEGTMFSQPARQCCEKKTGMLYPFFIYCGLLLLELISAQGGLSE